MQAQSLQDGCSLSEPLACRFFINTLRFKTRLYSELVRRDALECRSLLKLFELTKRCLSSAKLISQAEQLSYNNNDRGEKRDQTRSSYVRQDRQQHVSFSSDRAGQ